VEDYFATACGGLFEAIISDPATVLLLRRNLTLLRSLLDDKALQPVYAALRSDMEANAARGLIDPVDADYAVAVLRAASVEIAVVLLSRADPDVDAAVEFLTRVLGAAFRFR
jgi:hypothetical protein